MKVKDLTPRGLEVTDVRCYLLVQGCCCCQQAVQWRAQTALCQWAWWLNIRHARLSTKPTAVMRQLEGRERGISPSASDVYCLSTHLVRCIGIDTLCLRPRRHLVHLRCVSDTVSMHAKPLQSVVRLSTVSHRHRNRTAAVDTCLRGATKSRKARCNRCSTQTAHATCSAHTSMAAQPASSVLAEVKCIEE